MAKLVVFYTRADENYFGGAYKYITVGNTEKAAKMIAEKQVQGFLSLNRKHLTQPTITPVLHRLKMIKMQVPDLSLSICLKALTIMTKFI